MNKQFTVKNVILLILFLAPLFFSGLANAHGKVSLEDDHCVRGIVGSMVHLSTYQPQYDPEAEYCTEIPNEGKTFWVVDLIDQALRDMPIAVRIVKDAGEKVSKTVENIYSTNHPDGVIKGQSNLDEGLYTIFITGEGVPPVQYEYPLRVHLDSFFSNSKFNYATGSIILLLLVLFALFANKLFRLNRISH